MISTVILLGPEKEAIQGGDFWQLLLTVHVLRIIWLKIPML